MYLLIKLPFTGELKFLSHFLFYFKLFVLFFILYEIILFDLKLFYLESIWLLFQLQLNSNLNKLEPWTNSSYAVCQYASFYSPLALGKC